MKNDVVIVKQFSKAQAKRHKRQRRKERVRAYIRSYLKSHPCVACGTNDNLTFHHKNPEEKRMTIAKLVSYKSINAIQLEIDKCDILCRRCHDITHNMVKKTDTEVDICLKDTIKSSAPVVISSTETYMMSRWIRFKSLVSSIVQSVKRVFVGIVWWWR